ncbi:aprataxin and PNK-like factor isoform X3 [Sylvia atricapilla]|uniref:aprataxin and PNK-like factor isoform X3 n=1 Tax=Sylvia atricapilla TaxID=48155 RepID=UPI0033929E9F
MSPSRRGCHRGALLWGRIFAVSAPQGRRRGWPQGSRASRGGRASSGGGGSCGARRRLQPCPCPYPGLSCGARHRLQPCSYPYPGLSCGARHRLQPCSYPYPGLSCGARHRLQPCPCPYPGLSCGARHRLQPCPCPYPGLSCGARHRPQPRPCPYPSPVELGTALSPVPVPVPLLRGSAPSPCHSRRLRRSPEKNQEAGAEEALTVHAVEMSCIPLLMEPACSSSEGQGATKMSNNDAASRLLVPLSHDNENKQPKSIPRRRVLPSWMLERDLLVQKVSKPVMTGGSKKKKGQGGREGLSESLKSEVHVQQKKRLASEETTEDFEGGEQDQGKRSCLSIPVPSSQNASGFPLETAMRDMEGSGKTGTKNPGSSLDKKDRQQHSKCSKRVAQISSKDNRIEETENKEQITGSASQQAHWDRTSQCFGAQEGILEPDAHLDFNTEVSDSARSADASESSKQMQHKRTPCMYGSGCYRKNPIHFQQFSHPNDDDYHDMEVVAQGDSDNRPECPYGTACYSI